MTSSNRLSLSVCRESTPGVTPASPRMRLVRATGEQLNYQPTYVDSDEVRSDRMNSDPALVMINTGGSIPYELTYPEDNSPLSEFYRSGFFNPWVNTPTFDNDGTADSVITDAGTTANTYVVASGGATVVVGHLVRATGFGQSANNQIFRATTGSGTTIVGTSLSLVAETAPAAAAKLKVVGFQGASGDLTAHITNGLLSTALDFTTLGLAVGQSLKIGGTAAGDKFATAACNDWVRITAIAAHAITLDNLPSSWATDAGTGKTVKVWFGDQIKNGVTQSTMTIEKGFLGQAVPNYIAIVGQTVDTINQVFASKDKIKGTVAFKGQNGTLSTVTLDAVPDAVTTGAMITGNANVGRLAENGSQLVSPNWAKSFEFTINNNLREVEDVTAPAPVAIREGECGVSGKISTCFGDQTLLAKFFSGQVTSFNCRVQKNSQAIVYQFPRVTLRGGGNPQASAKNQDVYADFDFTASKDTLTSAHIICDRIPYYEV